MQEQNKYLLKMCVKMTSYKVFSLTSIMHDTGQFVKLSVHCKVETVKGSVADPDTGSGAFLTPGSGIRCLFDPWIRDPGWVKIRIRIRN
jgi:hypothetical protein